MSLLHETLTFLGGLWGDQAEYLVCKDGHKHPYGDIKNCPDCGQELYLHIPHRESLPLDWQLWKIKHLPTRFYVPKQEGVPEGYRAWRYKKREFLRRPYDDLDLTRRD